MKKHYGKIALILLGAVLLLLIRELPKGPHADKKAESLEAKIARASRLVEQGENPMEGIQLFREILAEDSNNIEVHYRLGLFSLQSGQLDKAVMRFEKVISLHNATYPDAHFYLGQALQGMGDTSQAIEAYTEYRKLSTDTVIIHGVDRIIKELSNKN